ncbi:Alpha/Beta hydrolase protein [Xylaria acuta]|nr:Alpha/Beta hydrolase protein [Xylaria acuta]
MAPRSAQWAIPLGVSLGVPVGLYVAFLFLGGFSFFQRHFFYAHRLNTLFWHDLDKPEYWGFARNQVTPFTLTSGNESLYAWHVLPLRSVLKHEGRLQTTPIGHSDNITATESFKILKEDPDAHLVISFHGNAGHIAQGLRTEHFHTLTDTSNFHILSIDYRGYGKSSGSPSEFGVIQDGIATIDWAMNVAGVSPDRIVVMGQSLGTAVTTGVVKHFATIGIEFAGVVLIAGFSNVPTLLSRYRGAGFIPVLSPLRPIPPLLRFFQGFIVDKWNSADRLAEVVRLTRTRLRLMLIHAKDDWEIPCHESDTLFKSAANATIDQDLDDESFLSWKNQRSTRFDDGTFISIVTAEPDIVIRQELIPYGGMSRYQRTHAYENGPADLDGVPTLGHNGIMLSSAVPLAVMRAFSSESNVLI